MPCFFLGLSYWRATPGRAPRTGIMNHNSMPFSTYSSYVPIKLESNRLWLFWPLCLCHELGEDTALSSSRSNKYCFVCICLFLAELLAEEIKWPLLKVALPTLHIETQEMNLGRVEIPLSLLWSWLEPVLYLSNDSFESLTLKRRL